MSNDSETREYLINTPIFGGMLRKPKIGGIPSDMWVFNMVISMLVFININPILAFFCFVVIHGALFILCLWDEDAFSLMKATMRCSNNPLRKIIGCNGYVAY